MRERLGEEKVGKLLLQFAIPSVISMLVSALYNIVDQIFIGNGIGINGNAATNVAFPLSTLCTSLALLFGIGGASNFNLSMGAGDYKKAAKYVGNAVFLLLSSGILLCILVRIFLQPLMLLFGATTDTLDYALEYTRDYILWISIFNPLYWWQRFSPCRWKPQIFHGLYAVGRCD